MELIRIVEGLAAIVLALLSYFGKRTLNNYDARFEKAESRDDEIMKTLNTIQLRTERIETILDSHKFRSRSSQ